MSQLHSVTVDGQTYEFGDWNTSKGISNLTWLAKKVGGTIAAFFAVGATASGDDKDKAKQIEEAGDRLFTEAIQKTLTSLDDQDVNKFLMSVASEDVLCEGRKIIYETHYKKRVGHLMRVAKANLEYQYDDFLGELLSLAKTQKVANIHNQEAPTGS